ncbi:MAG: aldo/keto reductase [Eubacteriales bacterium]|nr:aldo/keto reductase [Eubacteriales bacterium]
MQIIKKKKLPKLDIQICELGFGAWAISGTSYGNVDIIDAKEALDAYFNCGGNFVDTAREYGKSEEIIGEFLEERGIKNNVILATKTLAGEHLPTVKNIVNDLELSLKALKRDYIDIYYLHRPPEDTRTMNAALDIMEKLKKEGKIRAIGASIKGPDVTNQTINLCRKYIENKRINVIQLVYSILRQKNVEIFDEAEQNGIGLIGRTSLESGFLTEKYSITSKFFPSDHRHRWNKSMPKIFEAVNDIKKQIYDPYDSLTQIAIRFAMLPGAITSTIVGAKNRDQTLQNLNALSKPELKKEAIDYFTENYYDFTKYANTSF